MAVAQMVASQLTLILNDGDDIMTGKTIYKSKSFNNVKPTATPDQVFAIAIAVAGLQSRPLYNIQRKDSTEISQ
ncbi:DUF1659 domain-containing protein [Virgibacillus kekensis]|uniref:DUF1659 domain-containing protein n=1 Tax=Virgibacillus kekensis TaxID=202261 RepID=A0ABV9DHD7_9BACI